MCVTPDPSQQEFSTPELSLCGDRPHSFPGNQSQGPLRSQEGYSPFDHPLAPERSCWSPRGRWRALLAAAAVGGRLCGQLRASEKELSRSL